MFARKVGTMITTNTRDQSATTVLGDGPEAARAQATTMKAIVQDTYGTSEALDLRDIAKPEIGDSEVLVRVRAAGVNPGDWAIMGGLPYIARPVYGLGRPKNRVRGTDVAGGGGGPAGGGGRGRWGGRGGGGSAHPCGGVVGYMAWSPRPGAAT